MLDRPPKPHTRLEPKRLPVRKRMTAILGLHYLGGVLMMADTEETTSTATKSECEKFCRFTFPVGTVLTGGAGDTHCIEYANQELHRYFSRGHPERKATHEDILDGLDKFAQKLFRETIGQYRGFASELVPTLEMLITVNYEHHSRLFHLANNHVVWVPPSRHLSIGAGRIQLHPMLQDVQSQANKETMLFLGAKMMFHAKRIVQAVGGKTEAIALQNDGHTHYFGIATMKKVEDLVVNFEQFLTYFVCLGVSNISPEVTELDENINKLLADIPRRLHEYRDEYKTILMPSTAQMLTDQR
jgi:Proteasome subunit